LKELQELEHLNDLKSTTLNKLLVLKLKWKENSKKLKRDNKKRLEKLLKMPDGKLKKRLKKLKREEIELKPLEKEQLLKQLLKKLFLSNKKLLKRRKKLINSN